MSGDRLAEMKARAELFHATAWLGDDGAPAGLLYERADQLADDVLALVEIAKAARDIPDMDTPETDALYRALARLDSGAAEGDA